MFVVLEELPSSVFLLVFTVDALLESGVHSSETTTKHQQFHHQQTSSHYLGYEQAFIHRLYNYMQMKVAQ